MGNGVDDLELRLDGVALGLVGLRAEGHGSRHLAFSEAGEDFVGRGFGLQLVAARRYTGGDRFLKGVSWVASVSASRSLLLVS